MQVVQLHPANLNNLPELKHAMSCFGTGVTVITTHYNDQDYGMTCNSFNTVSLDPAMVLWSLHRTSMSRKAFEASGGYTVNILSLQQQSLAMRFTKGSQEERFSGVELARLPSGRPQIVSTIAWFDCSLESIMPAGDHDIMLGRVLSFGLTTNPTVEPLIYAKRQFGRFTI